MGPSLITAPDLIEGVFAAAGRRAEDYLRMVPLDPFYRIFFDDGRYFDYTGDQGRMEAEVAKFNPDDVEGYRRFMAGIKTSTSGRSPTWRTSPSSGGPTS